MLSSKPNAQATVTAPKNTQQLSSGFDERKLMPEEEDDIREMRKNTLGM